MLKADVQGSVEALTESLERLSTDEVRLKVIHGSVGAVNESDVMLASASNAIVLGFNVKADAKAAAQAQADGVDLRSYNVIYDAINDVKAALSAACSRRRSARPSSAAPRSGSSSPSPRWGRSSARSSTEGKIVRGARVRVKRGETVLGESTVTSLKRFKDDVREVLQGLECGIGVRGGQRASSRGDIIEAFTTRRGGADARSPAARGPSQASERCRRRGWRSARWSSTCRTWARSRASATCSRASRTSSASASRSPWPRSITTTPGSAPRWPLACVSGDSRHANEVISKAIDFIEDHVDGYVTDIEVEIL